MSEDLQERLVRIAKQCEKITNSLVEKDGKYYLPSPKHEHQHTIPVEWVDNGPEHYITKLRCVCGDEIDR